MPVLQLALQVPESAGVEVSIDAAVSSTDLEGFVMIENHHYRSLNYDQAGTRIKIDLAIGASNLNIKRYPNQKPVTTAGFRWNAGWRRSNNLTELF